MLGCNESNIIPAASLQTRQAIHKKKWRLGIFYLLKLSYFLHKHQMKATKNSRAYTVGTHGCV